MTPTDADRLKAQVEQNHHKSLGQAPGLFVLLHIYASLQIRQIGGLTNQYNRDKLILGK